MFISQTLDPRLHDITTLYNNITYDGCKMVYWLLLKGTCHAELAVWSASIML